MQSKPTLSVHIFIHSSKFEYICSLVNEFGTGNLGVFVRISSGRACLRSSIPIPSVPAMEERPDTRRSRDSRAEMRRFCLSDSSWLEPREKRPECRSSEGDPIVTGERSPCIPAVFLRDKFGDATLGENELDIDEWTKAGKFCPSLCYVEREQVEAGAACFY